MKKLLLATTALIPLVFAPAPVNATLQITFHDTLSGVTSSCSDGGLCDFAGKTGNLITLDTDVGAMHVFGTLSISSNGLVNNLSMSSFGIVNQGAASTLQILVGDNFFTPPVNSINESGALTFHNNVGAGLSSLQFFAGPGNAQPTLASPGGLLFTATGQATITNDSFDGTHVDAFSSNTFFAMAEMATFKMNAGASITGFEQGMTTSIPEPSTWAMMLLGFAGLAAFGRKRGFRLAA